MSVHAVALGMYVGCLWDKLWAFLKGSFIFSKAKSTPEYTHIIHRISAFHKETENKHNKQGSHHHPPIFKLHTAQVHKNVSVN